jgi:hypothetical protein
MALGLPELFILLILVVGMGLALAWPAARICKRAGFSPWLGLLILIPLANVFLLWFVAFTPWPALPNLGQDS